MAKKKTAPIKQYLIHCANGYYVQGDNPDANPLMGSRVPGLAQAKQKAATLNATNYGGGSCVVKPDPQNLMMANASIKAVAKKKTPSTAKKTVKKIVKKKGS